jgi:hypothetical protein
MWVHIHDTWASRVSLSSFFFLGSSSTRPRAVTPTPSPSYHCLSLCRCRHRDRLGLNQLPPTFELDSLIDRPTSLRAEACQPTPCHHTLRLVRPSYAAHTAHRGEKVHRSGFFGLEEHAQPTSRGNIPYAG